MKKTIVSLLLAAAVSAVGLAGCGNSGSSETGSSKVNEMEFVDEEEGTDSTSAEETDGAGMADTGEMTGMTGMYGSSGKDLSASKGSKDSITNTIDPGADQVSAPEVPFGTKLTEQIATDDADNWFSFVTGDSGTYTITAVNLKSEGEGDDINVRLCDTAGNDLGGVAAQHFGAPETIISTDLEQDSLYYIKVTGKQGNGYVLYLTSPEQDYDPGADLKEADAKTESVETAANTVDASLIPLNQTFTQSVGSSQNDWYAFRTKQESAVYTVTVKKTASAENADENSDKENKEGNVTVAENDEKEDDTAAAKNNEKEDDAAAAENNEKEAGAEFDESNEESTDLSIHLVDKFGNVMESQKVQDSQGLQDRQKVQGSQETSTNSSGGSETMLWNDLDPDTVYYLAVSGDPGTGYTIEVSEGRN